MNQENTEQEEITGLAISEYGAKVKQIEAFQEHLKSKIATKKKSSNRGATRNKLEMLEEVLKEFNEHFKLD